MTRFSRCGAVLVLLSLLTALVGCTGSGGSPTSSSARASSSAIATPGSRAGTVQVGGTTRSYLLHVPQGLARQAPLVVMLHGGFGSAEQAEKTYGWDALADRKGFAVLYPQGLNRAWSVGGGCCGAPGREGVDDVAAVTSMVDAVTRELGNDPRRRYVTGMSNGGLMTYRLACDTTLFAAAAPVAATQLGSCTAPAPISLLHIHGLADTHVRFEGGTGTGTAAIDGPPVPDVVAGWRAVDRCAPPVVTVAAPVTTSRAACADGRTVELITIAGAGHQWPGSPPRPAQEKLLGSDPPSTALDATATIWDFFSR